LEGKALPFEGKPFLFEGKPLPLEGKALLLEGKPFFFEGKPLLLEGKPFFFEGQSHPLEGQSHPLEGQSHPLEGQSHPLEGKPLIFKGRRRVSKRPRFGSVVGCGQPGKLGPATGGNYCLARAAIFAGGVVFLAIDIYMRVGISIAVNFTYKSGSGLNQLWDHPGEMPVKWP